MSKSANRVCVRCVMDTSDRDISFDENGLCSHCSNFDNNIRPGWNPQSSSKAELDAVISEIKVKQKGSKYHCIIGLSGGVDSSYLAYRLRKDYPELRILAVHVDGGWNSEEAVSNIKNIVDCLKIDFITEVISWKEMKDLQIAFLKSGFINQDVPQDHAFFANLNKIAKKNSVHYFLSGSNYSTESILPKSWGSSAMDSVQLKYISKKFGSLKLKNYHIESVFQRFIINRYIFKLNVIAPLNFYRYVKDEAKSIITKELGWKDYGQKHGESNFTAFYQSYYLPRKFNIDKRRAHLSSLIVAEQISREDALAILDNPEIGHNQERKLLSYIKDKLELNDGDFKEIMEAKASFYGDFPNERRVLDLLVRLKRLFG